MEFPGSNSHARLHLSPVPNPELFAIDSKEKGKTSFKQRKREILIPIAKPQPTLLPPTPAEKYVCKLACRAAQQGEGEGNVSEN